MTSEVPEVVLTANASGAVHRDRATSGGILVEAVGKFLWPSEVTADAQIKGS